MDKNLGVHKSRINSQLIEAGEQRLKQQCAYTLLVHSPRRANCVDPTYQTGLKALRTGSA